MVAGGGASVIYRYILRTLSTGEVDRAALALRSIKASCIHTLSAHQPNRHSLDFVSGWAGMQIHSSSRSDFSDTICDMGGAGELANYGEYSGAPTETQTYEYAKTIMGLMTAGQPRPEGKVLIVGGSIANFTNVAATFKVSAYFKITTTGLHNIVTPL